MFSFAQPYIGPRKDLLDRSQSVGWSCNSGIKRRGIKWADLGWSNAMPSLEAEHGLLARSTVRPRPRRRRDDKYPPAGVDEAMNMRSNYLSLSS